MAALTRVHRIAIAAVSAFAALVGAGSAFAASGATTLAGDPSGAKTVHSASMRSVLSLSAPAYRYRR
ncbi:hypothetical protein [Streptomyces roseochromogenus]|uniref:Uncharacterized protein n=1 Tax=Streptomyces roseochromogenus subsp. oscitans DS 12.976 TaxID=1352936 RepID=V6KNN4_STRRC|nr:hypothetical protein [Streptomyces roseochromogenus]EST30619.1 hypothetical protein M878_18045 [Streptomyces roseochromogenus subsp. oscitans DS 12.976]